METKALELDDKSKQFFITVLGQCRTVMNSVDQSQLQEPWLTHYKKIKDDYDSVLKELSPSDQVIAALDANRHLNGLYSMLTHANAMCSMLTNSISDMKRGAMNSLNSAVEASVAKRIADGELVAKADVDGKVKAGVDAAVTERVNKGELVAKDTHTQLCSAAKELGLKEGKQAAETAAAAEKTRLETIEKRKNTLATNGIPVPTADLDKILGGDDADFDARHTAAKTRMQSLMDKGLALNSDHAAWGNIWKGEAEFKAFEALAESLVGAEPFATGGSRAGSAPTGPFLC